VRVAVPFGATLVSLLCFGQAVRLAVHIGFNIRVIGVGRAMQHGEQQPAAAALGLGCTAGTARQSAAAWVHACPLTFQTSKPCIESVRRMFSSPPLSAPLLQRTR
jgi:putative effector of murein hydrolase